MTAYHQLSNMNNNNNGVLYITTNTTTAGDYITITTSNGTSTNPWYDNTYTVTNGGTGQWITADPHKGSLDVRGDANFKGKVRIQGKDLGETLDRIEERLAILHGNAELESRWEQLRELRKQYLELEADILQQEEVYRILSR